MRFLPVVRRRFTFQAESRPERKERNWRGDRLPFLPLSPFPARRAALSCATTVLLSFVKVNMQAHDRWSPYFQRVKSLSLAPNWPSAETSKFGLIH